MALGGLERTCIEIDGLKRFFSSISISSLLESDQHKSVERNR